MFRKLCLVLLWTVSCSGFAPQSLTVSSSRRTHALSAHLDDEWRSQRSDNLQQQGTPLHDVAVQRRDILTGLGSAMTVFVVGATSSQAALADDTAPQEESFAAIAARASQISKEIDKENAQAAANVRKSEKTAYDFTLPVEGNAVKFADLIKQEFYDDGVKVKAILVVNIKQDDPVARKTIPELISLATKFARNRDGALAIVCCPTCVYRIDFEFARIAPFPWSPPTTRHSFLFLPFLRSLPLFKTVTKDITNPTRPRSFVSNSRRNTDTALTLRLPSRTRSISWGRVQYPFGDGWNPPVVHRQVWDVSKETLKSFCSMDVRVCRCVGIRVVMRHSILATTLKPSFPVAPCRPPRRIIWKNGVKRPPKPNGIPIASKRESMSLINRVVRVIVTLVGYNTTRWFYYK